VIPLELLYILGAGLLFGALLYGVYRDRTRNKRTDAITEAATKEQYEHPERYEHTQELFEKAATEEERRPES
jgi:hypothetical protein